MSVDWKTCIVEMSVHSKASTDSVLYLSKPNDSSCRNRKIPKLCMEPQKALISQSNLETEPTWGHQLPGFRTHCKGPRLKHHGPGMRTGVEVDGGGRSKSARQSACLHAGARETGNGWCLHRGSRKTHFLPPLFLLEWLPYQPTPTSLVLLKNRALPDLDLLGLIGLSVLFRS